MTDPLRPSPFSVLVVCVGNLCRSPLAERLLQSRLRSQLGSGSAEVVVSSAGIHAAIGRPMDALAADELRRLGGNAEEFRATQLTEVALADADLVLTATKQLSSILLGDLPGALRRTFTLTELSALLDGAVAASPKALVEDAARRRGSAPPHAYDIEDPIGESREVHRRVAAEVDRCTMVIATALAASVRPDRVRHKPGGKPSTR